MGDGCLMEGIFYEVCLLVGMFGLGKLIGFYDYNGIFIDGKIEGWFFDDMVECFCVYYWYVIGDIDGYDLQVIKQVIMEVQVVKDKLLLIICWIIIGFGLFNKVGLEEFYGVVFGEKEVVLVCQQFGWKYFLFEILKEIYVGWDVCLCGEKVEYVWNEKFVVYQQQFLELVVELI